jgi:hypothetical protein
MNYCSTWRVVCLAYPPYRSQNLLQKHAQDSHIHYYINSMITLMVIQHPLFDHTPSPPPPPHSVTSTAHVSSASSSSSPPPLLPTSPATETRAQNPHPASLKSYPYYPSRTPPAQPPPHPAWPGIPETWAPRYSATRQISISTTWMQSALGWK